MVDRDARELGQQDDRLLVLGRELCGPLLFGQVQVSVRLPADQDRHAQERAHRGVAEREAVGTRMAINIGQPQRHPVSDEFPEHAPPPGQRPDLTSCGLIDA